MNDIEITVIGNVASDITMRYTTSGAPVASFRVAAGTRHFDRARERWIDGDTHFFSVSCFRDLAQNVERSLGKGQPVIIKGRLRSREVLRECGDHAHTTRYFDVEATVVGHDLSRGTAAFTRVKRTAVVENERRSLADSMAEAGLVEEDEALALAARLLADEHQQDDHVIDPQTGEILEPATV
jgi:single-strand DNA-binding protein